MKKLVTALIAAAVLVVPLAGAGAAPAAPAAPAALAVTKSVKDVRGDVAVSRLRQGFTSYSTKREVDILRTTYTARRRVLTATITTAVLDRSTLDSAERFLVWSVRGRVAYPDGTTGFVDAYHLPGTTLGSAEQDVPYDCPTRWRHDLAADTLTLVVDLSECAQGAESITLRSIVHGLALRDGGSETDSSYALHRDRTAVRTLSLR